MIRSFAAAVTFLTRIPIPTRVSGESDLARSVPWFPVVGLLVGGLVGSMYVGLAGFIGALPAAALAVGAGMLITGAFHEDGLADSFDGFGGGASSDRVLEIMKDSRLGTFGTAALVSVVVLRVGLISQLTDPESALRLVAAAAVMSRVGAIGVMAWSRSASASGLGSAYLAQLQRLPVLAGCVFGSGVVAVLVGAGPAAMGIGVTVAMGIGLRAWSYRRIQGVTGDVLGMVQQLTEAALLVVAVAGVSEGALSW